MSQKKIKAVLFDMDGVLFNSMPYHSEAWHNVMKSHGLTLSREPLLSILYSNANWVGRQHRKK